MSITAQSPYPSQKCRASPAIWHHRVLPATWHRWTRPAFTMARHSGTRFK